MEQVDLLVIGSGSGLDVANAAVELDQAVAIVEKGRLGGTCLNRGCIPSKKLLYHADVLETVERADEFGIEATVEDVAFADVVRDVNADVREDSESIRRGLESSPDHDLYDGEARFVDDRTVEINGGEDDGTTIRGTDVVIATGSRPSIPPIDGIDDVDYLTSKEALQLETLPDHLVIVGGGYVGAELGHFFGTFGSAVTIIGRRPYLLPDADEAVAEAFTERYADRFTVHTGYSATSVTDGTGTVTVEALPYEYGEDGGVIHEDPVSVTADELLVAAGRIPNTDALNLDATGVETDEAGFVETDEYLRTTAEGIWALGDVVGEYLLKHSANHEAQTVLKNILGPEPEAIDYTAMPFAVFASPEVAGVGATESQLRREGQNYATRTYHYDQTARGDAMHADGFLKAIIDPDGEILGCHILGPDASTLIQEVVVAMKAGSGTVQDIRNSIHIHPALSEVVQRGFSGKFHSGGNGHSH